MPIQLRAGVYAPVVTPFVDDEEVDYSAFQKLVVRIASAGVGILVAGTTGEAVTLSRDERVGLVRSAKEGLEAANLGHTPVIAGTGGWSTKETIQLCKDAAQAGADAVIVIPPGFFSSILAADLSTIRGFYLEVSEASPVPVLLYSYPSITGINMSSDFILEIARSTSNVCGVKLTCANVGKLVRIVSGTSQVDTFGKQSSRTNPQTNFLVFGGYSDFLLPSMIVQSSGCITGLANLAPRVIKRLYDVAQRGLDLNSVEDLAEAQRLQCIVSRADGALSATGIAGTKYILSKHYRGFGALPRRPLPGIKEEAAQRLEGSLKEILELEISLAC